MARNLFSILVSFLVKRFILFNLALNISGDLKFQTKFDPNFLRNKLLKEQEPDGSWKQLVDLNQKSGSLDATIFNCKSRLIQIGFLKILDSQQILII